MADPPDMEQILARMDRMEQFIRKKSRKRKKRRRSRRRSSSSSTDRSHSPERRREKRQRTSSPSEQSHSSLQAEESVIDDDEIVEEPKEQNIFGEKLYQDTVWAASVNPEIAVRWKEILLKGIPEENLKEILKNNPPPENCPRLVAPKMNEIIKGIMPEPVISRDNRILMRQEKISASMAAAAKVLTGILDDESIQDKKPYIQSLLESTKLLADLHHDESMIRRNLILTNVDKTMQNTLQSTSIDEFLFGKELEETVKSAKAMQTTGKDLKKTSAKPKNWKIPSRVPRRGFVKTGGTTKLDQRISSRKPQFQSAKRRQHSPKRKDNRPSKRQQSQH